MTQNVYNNPTFFEQYAQMSRSKLGLAGAGEWDNLQKILPSLTDKKVLDLGCGYGWHARYFREKGASSVLAIDSSEKMLTVAREQTTDDKITYLCQSIDALDTLTETFDLIFSSLVFHYIEDFQGLVKQMTRLLNPGGQLIFTVEHPIFTADGRQDWIYTENGEIDHFPVDRYYEEGVREVSFLGTKMTKYHRTLTTYLSTLLQNKLELTHVIEPIPPVEMLDLPGMKEESRRPMMLIISATKK
ncbi:class I SAM-dependent methyltransferase [Enterococcus alcedinis]|uniref:Methyltransferase n=1 Tax=Enterococcus alcedinis TaxID=1274384 RepID=A0A917N492_9ENTE|nr:class I SAM-dependent methyltransferase [Enterococcus alcedinis]MBP2101382.1 SAM-dependent methyltransferase [Enterococcus alcedinis]GGI65226.1 methyltransferase [Enterococcus alcedinis]